MAHPTCRIRLHALALLICLGQAVAPLHAAQIGPPRGSLFIHGGGRLDRKLIDRFFELAGGRDAPLVVIPTAGEDDDYDESWPGLRPWHADGATHVALLHTRDRKKADSESFVRPLESARAVWLAGGRQWRLADAYLGTRTEQAIKGVLARGGVVGGSSAGATIQGSYLVRGSPENNQIMMSPGHERGFALLRHTAIDQHLLARGRERDMLRVIARHPKLLGIGIDEGTAVIVHGDEMEVVGSSKVAIYSADYRPPADERPYYFLAPGEHFDLAHRKRLEPAER